MSKISSYSLFFLFSIFLTYGGCRQKEKKYIEFRIKDNKSKHSAFKRDVINKKYITLNPERIYGLFTNIAVVDSVLICGNLRSPKLISLYSLNHDTLIREVIQRGTAEYEGLSVASLYVQNDTSIWTYDITLGKLFRINPFQAIKDTAYFPTRESILVGDLKNLVSPEIISDSLILATTYSLDDNRYLYTDTKKVLKKVGQLPDVINSELLADPPATKFPNKAYIFKAISVKHPLQNKVAVFYNKTDRAEFYSDNLLINIVTSQEEFGPKMEITKLKDGYSVDEYDKSQFAYLSIAYTEDFIYCLYAGSKGGETCADKILVFDWSGNFSKELCLDRAVCKICIDPKNKILYCYENRENGIFSASLKF